MSHTNKGISRRKEEHSLRVITFNLFQCLLLSLLCYQLKTLIENSVNIDSLFFIANCLIDIL